MTRAATLPWVVDGEVRALAVADGELFVGGKFNPDSDLAPAARGYPRVASMPASVPCRRGQAVRVPPSTENKS